MDYLIGQTFSIIAFTAFIFFIFGFFVSYFLFKTKQEKNQNAFKHHDKHHGHHHAEHGIPEVPNMHIKEVPVEKIIVRDVIKEVSVPKIEIREVVKLVPVEKVIIKEVVKEIIKEVPVEKIEVKEIVKIIPVEKVIFKEVIKEVPIETVVTKEVVKEIIKEIPVEKIEIKEIFKEVPVEKIEFKEVIREVPVEEAVIPIDNNEGVVDLDIIEDGQNEYPPKVESEDDNDQDSQLDTHAEAEVDELSQIWGVGKGAIKILNENKIFTLEDLIGLASKPNKRKKIENLIPFQRFKREAWILQAERLLENVRKKQVKEKIGQNLKVPNIFYF